ncbi:MULTISPECIES: pyridoxal 5'-phosphate synthase [unclassified Brachybacterium]|uniref:pyridoxine/pyridoxamine 5'-phosphate oxidase n=1 Tax=unclassified Brachybacterium TaxID=2623841 RepID=UPI000C8061B5|nr:MULTISPECIES: pyridoxamine 5'-phosphate oxidase family protein [unclassified Brachybacterium]PMC76998.1 pyridoxamine 5'-phosphate oxidase [Brachybacterium sp. UMB0905]
MTDLAARLRVLPGFPPDLPVLDPDRVPEDPLELFLAWLEDAIAAGARQPHAMTFVTVGPDGAPRSRTLILKDVDEHGLHVSTHRTSRKGAQLAADPHAAMLFFWRESGRQVEVRGSITALDEQTSQTDWQARPTYDGRPNLDWQVYALQPESIEFLQAREDRQHTRIAYKRRSESWTHERVTTPAG